MYNNQSTNMLFYLSELIRRQWNLLCKFLLKRIYISLLLLHGYLCDNILDF